MVGNENKRSYFLNHFKIPATQATIYAELSASATSF